MERDRLRKNLDKIRAEKNTPQPLIDMFDALASPLPGLTDAEKVARFNKIMSEALKRLERKDA